MADKTLPKQPPHSIEAEQSVLGALLIRNELWFELADKLRPKDFYRIEHQELFEGIGGMISAGKTCDFLTLTEELRHGGRLENVGGASYIGMLAGETYSLANAMSYAGIVRERAALRSMIAVGSNIVDLGYRPEGRSVRDLIDFAEQQLFAMRQLGDSGREATHIAPLIDLADRRIEQMKDHHDGIAGLATGFTHLDRLTQGLEPGDLVIVAARPSMGKTGFASCIAENVATKQGTPVAIFSMEMTGAQIALRMLASFGRIPLTHLRSGKLTDADYSRLSDAERLLRDAPIYVDETPGLDPLQLRAKARRLVTRYGIQLIIIDYIQLMQLPNSENRTNEIAAISRGLKGLAKELGLPIIALSQLNRGLENRDNKRPRLADLRESGSIEQDADLVLFIYRDEVYNKNSPDAGRAEIIIGKQRNGPLDTIKTAYLGPYTRFETLADASYGDGHTAVGPHD